MLTVAVCDAAHKRGHDYLRPLTAHGQHGVIKNAIMSPLLKCLFLRLRNAKVNFCAPELFCVVILVSVEQLVGADDSKRVIGVGRHRILATLSASERKGA